ncbi:hypothetical protein Back11_33770 [Paenibacillus baekrokdamisoli]|uniref:Uncharacterized protein n=1 Tax=Paenibacillus baekrokdamisoli TaxID=1712516 RepID=A0A3G9IUZ5_9BACL|nr:extracellular solute-binding protein [Paenibacillus baekrokdamisoli]MBB3073359.1 ABC-type glycerol-3-phosphate transport system substrate-binding protein [Paenibacillus baekrokdamisoli]BBH22032.1 hypothetical protein Back11_33770 [Paenibacillus baekrokdamisoli]
MTKKLSIRFTAVILSLVLILVGCSTNSKSTDTGTAKDTGTAVSTDATTDAATDAGTAAATTNGEKVTIRMNMGEGEITKDQITEFNKDHPNINLERVDADFNKLMAAIAANSETTPDILRVNGGNEFPFYAARGLALNLQPYFDASTVFKKDDLLSIGDIFKWDGQNQGTGDLYGFVKDWQPETDMYINKKLFAEAGIPIPDDKTALTWDQVADYAKKLTKKDGDKFIQWGYTNPFIGGVTVSQATLHMTYAVHEINR